MERGLLDIRTGEPFAVRDRLHHRDEIGLDGAAGAVSPRGRQLIGARGVAMGGARKLTARDYVQDGLIAMWDGIENAGWGVHDESATVWKDVINGNDIRDFSAGVGFGENYFETTSLNNCAKFNNYGVGKIGTVEIIITPRGYNGQVFVTFSSLADNANRWFGIRSNKTFNFGQRADCAYIGTPLLTHYYAGTSNSSSIDNIPFSNLFLDGVPVIKKGQGMSWLTKGKGGTFNTAGTVTEPARINTIRLYKVELTPDEIAHNYAVDKARFNLA